MGKNIRNAVKALAVLKKLADGSPYQSLSVNHTHHLSEKYERSGRDIELAALEDGIIPERYARNIKTLSTDDQIRLLSSHVGIVGLGGLGGTVTEILARIGVGELTLIDGDTFEDSNLNRQQMSSEKHLNASKAEVAEAHVRRINSSVMVRTHRKFLTKENAARLIDGSRVVVDCLDNVPARFVLEHAASQIDACFVSAAVAGVSGHVTTIFPGDQGLKLIYGKPELAAEKGAETSLGNLPTIVNMVASLECAEVVKVLLDKKDVLRNRLLILDLADNTFEVMQLI